MIYYVNGKSISNFRGLKTRVGEKTQQKTAFTCTSKCDGTDMLCKSIAKNITEKIVCLRHRIICISRCTEEEEKLLVKKIEEKKKKKEMKKTPARIGTSDYFIIEEDIQIN